MLADFTRHGLTGSMAGEALQESLHGVLEMQQKLGIPMVRNAKGGVDLMRSLEGVRQHYIALYGSETRCPAVSAGADSEDVWHSGHARVPARPGRS